MWRRSIAATDVQAGSLLVRCSANWRNTSDAADTVAGRDETVSWSRYAVIVPVSSGARRAIAAHATFAEPRAGREAERVVVHVLVGSDAAATLIAASRPAPGLRSLRRRADTRQPAS